MQRAITITEVRQMRRALTGTVAFVPTMGFLHDGHLALMRRGLQLADHLAVSIFVNPAQFGPGEDLAGYPRDPKGDAAKCKALGCDLLFTPAVDEIYGDGDATTVVVSGLDESLCGTHRPGHFRGVTTVVSRLFHLVDPDWAIFGEKDYQQLAIIRRMTADLKMPITIEGVPTVRDDDGLALSSRNRYLSPDQRRQATCMIRGLIAAHTLHQQAPTTTVAELIAAARASIDDAPAATLDYLQCVDPATLEPLPEDSPPGPRGAVIAAAIHLGDARLIDNLRLDQPLAPGPLRRLP